MSAEVWWIAFFGGAIGYIWIKRPPLPKGSGKNTEWIRYELDPNRWRRYAYLYTLVCLGGITLTGAFQLQLGRA